MQLELPLAPVSALTNSHPHAKPIMVSRWPGDGPWQIRDVYIRDLYRLYAHFFDGEGICASSLVYCGDCDLYHPERPPRWGNPRDERDRAFDDYRCQFRPRYAGT